MDRREERRILRILEDTYGYAMYVRKDRSEIPAEFHRSFQVLIPVLDGESGRILDADWRDVGSRSRWNPKAIERETTFDYAVVDITGKAAVGKVGVRFDGRLTYTDYVFFTKIDGEWRMVGKMFHTHTPRNP
jgi:hypothetical protein